MPVVLKTNNGFIHSITGANSPVKPKFSSVTETQQFIRWFGDWQNKPKSASKVVDKDGKPLVVYHQTNADFTVFDTEIKGAEYYDDETPIGIFLKPSDSDIGINGKKHSVASAKINEKSYWDSFLSVACFEDVYYNVIFSVRSIDSDVRGQIYDSWIKKEANASHGVGTQNESANELPNYGSQIASTNIISDSSSKINTPDKKSTDRFNDTDYFDELFDMGDDLFEDESKRQTLNELIDKYPDDALMLGGTLDDSVKEERDFVLGLLKGKTLIVTDYSEPDIRENYGDLNRYRSKLGHGYIALERNAKKKLDGVRGVYIKDIIAEVQQAYPALVDNYAFFCFNQFLVLKSKP